MNEDFNKAMEENMRKATEAIQRKTEEMQQQAGAMQEQMLAMQQQAIQAGGMTPEMMEQMQQLLTNHQQQAMDTGSAAGGIEMPGMPGIPDMSDLSGLGALAGLMDDDEEEVKAFIAAHPQPEELSKYLALGSFLISMDSDPVETLEQMSDIEYQKENIEESWGIDDRNSLLEMLENLFEGHAYISYNGLYLEMKADKMENAGNEDVDDYQTTINSLLEIGMPGEEIAECPSIMAWDIERLAYLSRVGAHVGYITQDEAWEWLKKAAQKTKEEFKDWREYAVSMVMGRALQMGYHEAYFYAVEELFNTDPDFLNQRPLSNL